MLEHNKNRQNNQAPGGVQAIGVEAKRIIWLIKGRPEEKNHLFCFVFLMV